MKKAVLILLLALLALTAQAFAGSYTIDFEGLPDGTLIDNNYSSLGVIFQNAAIATAGITLNEFDFPPHSGVNVAFDALGPITLLFSTPISSFSAYFTYAELLTMTAYNAQNQVVGTASSLFSANYVSSGNPPNELIGLNFLAGISSITIAADPLGGSFTMDDASFDDEKSGAPFRPRRGSNRSPATLTSVPAKGLIAPVGPFMRRFDALKASDSG